jgi:hypothetical protein
MAYRTRRARKPCRHSTDGHCASRKPNRCPYSGCISFGDSCQDKQQHDRKIHSAMKSPAKAGLSLMGA